MNYRTSTKQMSLTHIILETGKEFVQKGFASSVPEINNGECAYFSKIVKEKFEQPITIVNSDTFLAGIGWGWADEFEETWVEDILLKFNSIPPKGYAVTDLGKLSFGFHQWMYFDGKHYDAQCPEGVENLFDLPFYKDSFKSNSN